MSTHTPTPWRLGMESGHNAENIYAAGGEAICSMYGLPMHTKIEDVDVSRYGRGMADAAFIVKAVNSHDILVSALLMSRAVHQDMTENYEPSTTEHGMAMSAIKTIDAALSRAEAS